MREIGANDGICLRHPPDGRAGPSRLNHGVISMPDNNHDRVLVSPRWIERCRQPGRATRIVFVSTNASVPWGGSEELWSQTALDLLSQGLSVSANLLEWSPLHPRVIDLQEKGMDLRFRPRWYSFAKHPLRRMAFWLENATGSRG